MFASGYAHPMDADYVRYEDMSSGYVNREDMHSKYTHHEDMHSKYTHHEDMNSNYTHHEDMHSNHAHYADSNYLREDVNSKDMDHLSFSDVSNSGEPPSLPSTAAPLLPHTRPTDSLSKLTSHATLRGIDDKAEDCSRRGTALFQSKAYEEAFQQFTAALRFTPSDSILLSNRAACLLAMKKPNRALKDALYVTQLDPERSHGFMRSGQCYLLLGELTKWEWSGTLILERAKCTRGRWRSAARFSARFWALRRKRGRRRSDSDTTSV